MTGRRLVIVLLAFGMLVLHATPALAAQKSPSKISDALAAEFDASDTVRFVVEFSGKADLSAARKVKSFTKRGSAVISALQKTARGQDRAAALAIKAKTRFQSFWLSNVMVVNGDAELAKALAVLSEVTAIRTEKVYPLVKPVETKAAILAAAGDPEWGVEKIGADRVWADGIVGAGVVVANVDTGVDYLHPALVNQYRGNLGDGTFVHDYNWWDPTGICGTEPCDNAAHGTHTMGTMVGGDGPGPFTPDIGVAPSARWIAAKGCEEFFCTETSLLSSGQFILAPTDSAGQNPDPSKRPDIVNNSWGGGPGDTFYLETVEAWRAAGIIPVFSSGNPGPFCGEGGSPGDFTEVISAGATDLNDEIAEFSGRGPSVFGKINPDVAAPGVDVVSSIPGGDYASFSGTSMAAPHTAGTLALMLSAKLELIGQFDGAADALKSTALDRIDTACGGADDGDPNNVYGDGRIDAASAVALVKTGGTLQGTVTDGGNASPIGGATVTADNGSREFSTVTEADGTYSLFLAAGTYTVSVSAFGYESTLRPGVEIVTEQRTIEDFGLQALPRFQVTGTIRAAENGGSLAGATVRALGTPVEPAVSAADGTYALTLPVGGYTLAAGAGGCTETGIAEVVLLDADIVQNFSLAQKLDNVGHACAATAFEWVEAPNQTALFGDEFVGRLSLPFDFPFYGETYSQVFITDNGYLTFAGPDQFNPFPSPIPSSGSPNAAVYALWQDMFLDAQSTISYGVIGTAPDRAFVLEFDDIKPRGASGRLDYEVKLWESGVVDLLYGNNAANPGDGRSGLIGVENADGTDAFQFSFLEQVLGRNQAFRISTVPTGFVQGVVTDANDGQAVVGATVTAQPGGRTATTGIDGTYELRLLPGSYTLIGAADHYVTGSQSIQIGDGAVATADFTLQAPTMAFTPESIEQSVDLDGTVTVQGEIRNDGSAPLTFEIRERPVSSTPPELPPVPDVTRTPTWGPIKLAAGIDVAQVSALPPEALLSVIDDPADDSTGSNEITTVRGGADSTDLSVAIDFDAATPMGNVRGFVYFDTDQDQTTGFPPEWLFGLPTQDLGVDYFADLFYLQEPEPFVLIWDSNFELVAEVPARIEGQSVLFDVPLEALGGDDGFVNVDMIAGDSGPEDWAADVGHGTIEPWSDLPWISAQPVTGTINPGESAQIEITLGGEAIPPALYEGLIGVIGNAPRTPVQLVPLSLNIKLPDNFGAIAGIVSDSHTGEPLKATVTLHAENPAGTPYLRNVQTAADGSYRIFGPAGTWEVDFVVEGFVTTTKQVEITAGASNNGVDTGLHFAQPHALLVGGPFEFLMLPGGKGEATVTLSNPDGHSNLTFDVNEVNIEVGGVAGVAGKRTLPAGFDRSAKTTADLKAVPAIGAPQVEGDILASWPTGMSLPWGVGFTGDVWLSDPNDLINVSFTADGERLAEVPVNVNGVWGGDMAFDRGRGLIWQVNVGGDNGIYGFNPADGSIEQVITGSPWDGVSQRGLAYDPVADVFYIGGWNEGIVYRVAGPSWPTPGESLNQCSPADPNISGLAWNGAFQLLWEATNSETDDIHLIDPVTCETFQTLPHPTPGFNGAGIELDTVGNLWTVSQGSGNAYLVESGLPLFSDAPWLNATPLSGSLGPDGSSDIRIAVDATGLEPGNHQALVVITTNDPDNSTIVVPVVLRVTDFQVGINAGGPAYTTAAGVIYGADRAYVAGGAGYQGGVSEAGKGEIKGTDEDPLFLDYRVGMQAYRFSVENGIYRVELSFAELARVGPRGRVFHVSAEGNPVLFNFDIFKKVGRKTALTYVFEVEVTDGVLDLGFLPQRGRKPIVNGLLVSRLP